MNDALMIGIVLTLVFGAVVFYLYNRLSMTERKMGLVEGILTDLKIMMDSAPFATSPSPYGMSEGGYEFEPTPEYLNAISGPIPLQKDEVEDSIPENEYQQTLEEAMNTGVTQGSAPPFRNLQIDELGSTALPAINVTKLSPDLTSLTVKELQTLAKENSISVPAGTRRKDLIELLRKADVTPGESHVQNGVALQPSSEATQGLQGSLLASFDGPAPPAEGAPFEST
jgi:hypothetical protein